MTEAPREGGAGITLSPGDVVAIETESGARHVQVTHARAPYPDVIRAIRPGRPVASAEAVAAGETAFAAMVELARSLRENPETTRRIGSAPIPASCQAFPTFRVPIRNRTGSVVYWWTWDGDGLAVAPEAAESDLPLREVTPFDALRARLAGLRA